MAKPSAGPVKAAQSDLNISAADPYNPIMAGQSDIHGPVMRNGLSDLAQTDVFQRLLKERIIFLGTAIDETVANLVCSQLLLLSAEDHERDIHLYINSPGGSVTDGLAIYDTMQFVACDVRTTCVGLAASMGQFLLCAGAPGKRYALPHSRILMHQPSGQMQGHSGRADRVPEADDGRADRLPHGPAHREDRSRLRPRPVVHGGRSQGLRVHRPGDRARFDQGRPHLISSGRLRP
jgi:hypothetical protein